MSSPDVAALSSRDRHLFGSGPKRMLSLDGGSIRGAISIAILEQLEKLIEEVEGRPTLLSDWFDFIGGHRPARSSRALWRSAFERPMCGSFITLGPKVFRRSFWRIAGFMSKFERQNLIAELNSILGNRTLDTDDLRTGLGVVAKRLDTGSCWAIANNPR